MTLLAKARNNRLSAIVTRLDRLDLPSWVPMADFHDRRLSTRNVTLRSVA